MKFEVIHIQASFTYGSQWIQYDCQCVLMIVTTETCSFLLQLCSNNCYSYLEPSLVTIPPKIPLIEMNYLQHETMTLKLGCN